MPLEERKGIPHHLIDFVSLDTKYTAGEWAREAAKKIEDVETGACPNARRWYRFLPSSAAAAVVC